MTKEQIAYVAGIFDGEGWIGIGDGGAINIRIVNTNRELIDYLHKNLGGQIYTRKPLPKRKQVYDFILRDRDGVVSFINQIYPYLMCKKSEVNTAVDKHRGLRQKEFWL